MYRVRRATRLLRGGDREGAPVGPRRRRYDLEHHEWVLRFFRNPPEAPLERTPRRLRAGLEPRGPGGRREGPTCTLSRASIVRVDDLEVGQVHHHVLELHGKRPR